LWLEVNYLAYTIFTEYMMIAADTLIEA